MDKSNRKIATALTYKKGDNAPVVVASGKGVVAEQIIRVAKENKVPVHTDPDCARLLSLVEIDSEIPEELYGVVAKILVFVSDIDKKYQQNNL